MNKHNHILVIDDEQVVIDSIIKIASLEDCSIDYAMDGIKAVEKFLAGSYDLIICDIMLPGMNGFQILNELQTHHIQTPAIMTTGYSTIDNAVKSLYMGAIDFIPKPFSIDEMISGIKRGIRYNNMLQQNKISPASLMPIPCPAKYFRLGYSCWMNEENDGTVLIGASDFFIKTLGQVKAVELMDVSDIIQQASYAVKFSSEDDVIHQLYAVISGTIIDRNTKLLETPELLEKDPYFEGWIYRIIPSELEYEKKQLIPCSSDR